MKQYLSDSGLSLYYSLIDSQTISVTYSPLTINEENLCDFNELKSKAESFCLALYNDIMRLFPGFFETWELCTGGVRNVQGETQSEEIIRRLHWK